MSDAAFSNARTRLATQAGQLLAKLHAASGDSFDFLEAYPDSVDAINAQRQRLALYGEPHPALELGLRWLERNRPPVERRVDNRGPW